MIIVQRAPAYATIQDSGRRGFLASGVPRAGAMDRPALDTLNALVGNDSRAAGIEWALTDGELRFSGHATFAIGGADALVTLHDGALEHYRAYHAADGDVVRIGAPGNGRFLYFAAGGGIDCPVVMGSRSTYLPGGFGGFEGRRLKSGDVLSVAAGTRRRRHQVSDALPADLRPPLQLNRVRFVRRDASSPTHSLTGPFTISAASDRTGYRLAGGRIDGGGSIISEPVCPGVIQLPPGGEVIVLMADAPTIGGYRIAGTVITADLGALAQRVPGSEITLEPVTVGEAQREVEARADVIARVREWSLG